MATHASEFDDLEIYGVKIIIQSVIGIDDDASSPPMLKGPNTRLNSVVELTFKSSAHTEAALIPWGCQCHMHFSFCPGNGWKCLWHPFNPENAT